MTVFTEGNLQIQIPAGVQARKFDNGNHGLTHCMKAVDFIVELKDKYYFFEFKDPQHPRGNPTETAKFVKKFQAGEIDEDFKHKYRDSFLYEWASGKADKPIYYFVLLALDALSEIELVARTDDLKRKLPYDGPPSGAWTQKIVQGCAVFNIDTWNRYLTSFPVSRMAP